MKRKQLLNIIAVVILILTLTLFFFFKHSNPVEINVDSSYVAKYIRDVDGDTAIFKINDQEYRVRFIGIDTPESVKPNTNVEAYAKEAAQFTSKLLKEAKEIVLETDSEANLYDKHERLLAYVFVDGEMLQLQLLEAGLAEVKYIYGDYKYLDELYAAQDIAKSQKLNLWAN